MKSGVGNPKTSNFGPRLDPSLSMSLLPSADWDLGLRLRRKSPPRHPARPRRGRLELCGTAWAAAQLVQVEYICLRRSRFRMLLFLL